MRAVVVEQFGVVPDVRDVPDPDLPAGGAIVRVEATGVCRSDWHGWRGHDPDITLPHVPGHEFAGTVVAVAPDVRGWRPGARVTAPFVYACGRCEQCRAGDGQVCPHQTQPGFTHDGSFAEFVVVHHAEVNLVALPDAVDPVAAASLGCRFATAHRAVVVHARPAPGQWLAVHGCGGVGLAAVMIGVARGARVVAVDVDPAALAAAAALGAELTLAPPTAAELLERTGGGAHASVDALGRADTFADALAGLRPRGRHVQVGLLTGDDAAPPVDMARVIGRELEILGSHGMAAVDYPAMLADIAAGRLDPARLVGRTVGFDELPAALAAMDAPDAARGGMTVAVPRRNGA
ncbi:alcohol dehydrogenase catalytic domain-containing protein [Jatrophihabitans sp. YIM 134969]